MKNVAEAVFSENKSPFENKILSRRATVRLVEEMNRRLPIELNDVVQLFVIALVLTHESVVLHACYKFYPSSLI